MVVTDPYLAESEPVALVLEALRGAGVDAVLFDQVRVEPTDESFQAAIAFAVEGRFDGYVAVGGGSSIDTAKAANLYATYPADFLAYVNPPIGEGRPVPGQLKPLIAIPTTAGTGSETTGVAIFDLHSAARQDGHRAPRAPPRAGPVDPDNTRDAAAAGRRVLGTGRSEPRRRVADRACRSTGAPRRSTRHCGPPTRGPTRSATSGPRARSRWSRATWSGRWRTQPTTRRGAQMLLAADLRRHRLRQRRRSPAPRHVLPGLGHGPRLRPRRLPGRRPLIPHGMSVILNAPAVFRFTAPADPGRHLEAARLMGRTSAGPSRRTRASCWPGQSSRSCSRPGCPTG